MTIPGTICGGSDPLWTTERWVWAGPPGSKSATRADSVSVLRRAWLNGPSEITSVQFTVC